MKKMISSWQRTTWLPAIAAAVLFLIPLFSAQAHISGTVFCDQNGNGVQDPGEPGIPNALILVCDGRSTNTDANGFYYFPQPPQSFPCNVTVDVSSVQGGCNVPGCPTSVTLTWQGSWGFSDVNFCFHPPQNCACPGSVGSVPLGTLTNGLVIGLTGTKINNSLVTINGNEFVSQGGSLVNMAPSTINGNVYEFANNQYSGPGKLNGSLFINPALLNQINTDALAASAAAANLVPTVLLGTVSTPTLVTGNGGQNVIMVNGDIKSTLVLNGTASDVFIVNVTGTLTLGGSTVLATSGSVASANVLYNFVGANGTITTHVGNTVSGTLLAPHYSFSLDGAFNGRIIGGGSTIVMKSGTKVNQPTCPPCP